MMQKFYDLVRRDYQNTYADALMRGTYEELPRCPRCRVAARKRIAPLVIEWDRGSDVIADFTWPSGLSEIVVSDRVKAALVSKHFTGVSFAPVEMFQRADLKKPRTESRSRRRVWLPYAGPALWNLLITSWCDLDVASSGRMLAVECEQCQRKRMVVNDPTAPLVVTIESWTGSDFFSIHEMGGLTFVSEAVKELIEHEGFTNVSMKERGAAPL
jgi:hypothetical protein